MIDAEEKSNPASQKPETGNKLIKLIANKAVDATSHQPTELLLFLDGICCQTLNIASKKPLEPKLRSDDMKTWMSKEAVCVHVQQNKCRICFVDARGSVFGKYGVYATAYGFLHAGRTILLQTLEAESDTPGQKDECLIGVTSS